jgi:rhomboid protease GluP
MPPNDNKNLAAQVQQLALRQLLAASLRRRVRLMPWLLLLLALIGLAQSSADRWLGPLGSDQVLLAGALIPDAVLRGQTWRVLSSAFLHADFVHLLLNGVTLWVVGRPVEAAWGSARFVLLYVGSAMAGGLATLALQEHGWTVGASGAVYGLMGALVALGARLWPRLNWPLRQTMVLLPALLLLILLAIGDEAGRVDLHAHRGGALGGFLLGLILRPQLRLIDALGPRDALRGQGIRWLSRGAALSVGLSLSFAAATIGLPPVVPTLSTQTFALDALIVRYPAGLRRGIWSRHAGRCEGAMTDAAWALRTGRTPCFPLPLGGHLLLGERSHLLTMDDADLTALEQAKTSGGWIRRQEGTLVFPVGDKWLWVVTASEALLPAYRMALHPLVAAPKPAAQPD